MNSVTHTIREKAKLLARVCRLRRQVRAVERALMAEIGSADVLRLAASIRGAVNGLTAELLEDHIRWIRIELRASSSSLAFAYGHPSKRFDRAFAVRCHARGRSSASRQACSLVPRCQLRSALSRQARQRRKSDRPRAWLRSQRANISVLCRFLASTKRLATPPSRHQTFATCS
jgi:DNA-binding FrmR family transcriptional regulator